MRAFLKIVGTLILAALAVLAGAAAVTMYMVRQPPELAKEMRPVPTSSEAAANFDQKVRGLGEQLQERRAASAAAGPTPTPIALTLTEQEVTAKVNQMLGQQEQAQVAAGGIPLRDVQLNFDEAGQTVRGSATWEYQGFTGQVAAEAGTALENRRLQVDVKSLQVGGAGAPAAVVEQVQAAIQSQAGKVQIPDWIQDIRITEDGRITVKVK